MEASRRDGSVIRVEVAGEQRGAPVLFCHGLADSRLPAHLFGPAAREMGLRVVAPDRPGTGGTVPRRLRRLADWVADAALVLDALAAEPAALAGISAPGQRLSLAIARRAPGFGGWFLGRLAVLARRSPRLFLRLAASELPGADRRALAQPGLRESFLANYLEAFRRGSRGVAQGLRLLTRPWGFEPGSIQVPTWIHHGDADTTVPPGHARLFAGAIPGARLQLHPGHGHFSILDAAGEMLAPLAG